MFGEVTYLGPKPTTQMFQVARDASGVPIPGSVHADQREVVMAEEKKAQEIIDEKKRMTITWGLVLLGGGGLLLYAFMKR